MNYQFMADRLSPPRTSERTTTPPNEPQVRPALGRASERAQRALAPRVWEGQEARTEQVTGPARHTLAGASVSCPPLP